MSVIKKVDARARQNAKSGTGSKKEAIKGKWRAGKMVSTDLARDLKLLLDDLTNRQCRASLKKCNTIVRKRAVANIKKGGGPGSIGQSKKNNGGLGWRADPSAKYGTRGDYKNAGGTSLKDGWAGKVLSHRGANKRTIAHSGGEGGSGIISRTPVVNYSTGNKVIGITGPSHSGKDRGDSSGKHGYNYAHMLEFGGKHVAWDGKTTQANAKPFMGPAGRDTLPQQIAIIKADLVSWGIG